MFAVEGLGHLEALRLQIIIVSAVRPLMPQVNHHRLDSGGDWNGPCILKAMAEVRIVKPITG
jgi:hypothetical protein